MPPAWGNPASVTRFLDTPKLEPDPDKSVGLSLEKRQSERGSTNRAAMGWDATRGSEPEDGLDAAEHEHAAS